MSNMITAAAFGGSAIPAIQLGVSQNVSYNAAGGASVQSAAFGDGGFLIEVAAHITGSGVRIAIGANPTATATSKLLPGSGDWFFCAAPGWKIAVLSDDTATGSINVVEATSMG